MKTSHAAALLGRNGGSARTPAKAAAARSNGARGGRPEALTGGRRGFASAVQAAFSARVHNPVVRYSHARGFHVESAHTDPDQDVLWERAANYILPTGRRSIRPADYAEIREEVAGA